MGPARAALALVLTLAVQSVHAAATPAPATVVSGAAGDTPCADAASFDPAAPYDYLCIAELSAELTKEQCSIAGCFPVVYSAEMGYCSCQVTDSDACLAKLPGELSRARVLCEVDGRIRPSDIGMAVG